MGFFAGAPVGPTHLAAMLEAMAHRGPDGAGQRVLGCVGLGHCLFSTTPESIGEQQPIREEESGCWLVGDLRIDNREELIGALLQARVPLRVGTDAELVLRAYRLWGETLPAKLRRLHARGAEFYLFLLGLVIFSEIALA